MFPIVWWRRGKHDERSFASDDDNGVINVAVVVDDVPTAVDIDRTEEKEEETVGFNFTNIVFARQKYV